MLVSKVLLYFDRKNASNFDRTFQSFIYILCLFFNPDFCQVTPSKKLTFESFSLIFFFLCFLFYFPLARACPLVSRAKGSSVGLTVYRHFLNDAKSAKMKIYEH